MPGPIAKLRQLLDRRAGIQFAVILCAVLVMSFLEMLGLAAILPFMQLVTHPELIETDPRLIWAFDTFGFSTPRQLLIALGVVLLVIFTISTVFSAFTLWLIQRNVWSMAHRICMRLLRNYATLPYAFHLEHNSSDLTKRVLVDVGDLVMGVLMAGSLLVANVVRALLLFGLMLAVRPGVALTAFGLLGGAYALIHLGGHAYLRRLGRERLDVSYARLRTFTEAMTGVKAIRTEGAEEFFLARFEDASQRFAQLHPRYQLVRLTPRYFIELVAFGGLVVVVLVMLSTGGELVGAIPALTFFALGAYKLLPAFNRAFLEASQLSHHLPAVDAVVEDLQVATRPAATARPAPVPDLPFEQAVRLDDVSFAYDASRDVVSHIDLVVPRHGSIGLIGATGCGKTTIVDILIGLLAPTGGRLMVDDTEITPDNAGAWRRRVAYVPQDIFLYDDTITRNIAFGLEASEIDEERVREAARIARLDDFVAGELPEGYATVIGERGVRLSGGQRQRIGLARAFYRRPDLLVLDEATSALDGITEQAVMDAIRTALPDVTLLMIAHRLSTIRTCDCIHLVDAGRIVKSGTFDELHAASEQVRFMAKSTS